MGRGGGGGKTGRGGGRQGRKQGGGVGGVAAPGEGLKTVGRGAYDPVTENPGTPLAYGETDVKQIPYGQPIEPLDPRSVVNTPEIEAAMRAAIKGDKQMASAYDDLPPVENANRYVDNKGRVVVGDKGAPNITEAQVNAEFLTDAQARAYLRDVVGVPQGKALRNLEANGQLKVVATLAKGGKYRGEGVEGMGIQLPNSDIVYRFQHGGGKPLATYDMGKVGVYPEWIKEYKLPGMQQSIWVEAKESVVVQGRYINNFNLNGDKIKANMERNIRSQVRIEDLDAHGGNWGLDAKGRARVFDPGAYRGDMKNVAIWAGEDSAVWMANRANRMRTN